MTLDCEPSAAMRARSVLFVQNVIGELREFTKFAELAPPKAVAVELPTKILKAVSLLSFPVLKTEYALDPAFTLRT